MRLYPDSDSGYRGLVAILFVVAAGALAYFAWKKFKGVGAGNNGTGGSGKTSAGANAGSGSGASAKRTVAVARPKAPVSATPVQKAVADGKGYDLEDIAGMISKSHTKTGTNADNKAFGSKFDDKIVRLADQLKNADKEAAQFYDKFGTTPNINKTLAEIYALNDEDFRKVMQCFKVQFNDGKDYFETNLAKGHLDTYNRVLVINRVFNQNAN